MSSICCCIYGLVCPRSFKCLSLVRAVRGLHSSCLTVEHTSQCSELFRGAQHWEIGCRFLTWARCYEKGNYLPSDMLMTHLLHLPTNHKDESEFTPRIVTCNFLCLNEDQPWLIYLNPLLHSRRFCLGLQPAQEAWCNICNGAALLIVRSALSVDPFRSSLTHKLYTSNPSSRLPKTRVCRRAVFSNTSVCPAAPLSNYSLSPSFAQ